MAYCININHPDYLKLLSESKLSPAVLKAKMAVWMVENNTTEFPSLEDLEKDTPLYQLNRKEYYKQKLKEIFFNNIYNKNLTDYDIQRIDGKLREISRDAGDVDYFVRESKAGNLYIAGYKNGNVLSDDYYSPYANGIFRQLKKTNREKRIKELENKLLSWARAHGISVTSIKEVMAKFPQRYSDNAAGIADFTKGLIALADDINIDTIPEEVGHFAVEIMLQQQDQGVIDALEQVVETAEYAQVKEDYDGIYKDEKDFRKEALGKILAAEIVNQYKLSEELAEPNSIWDSIVDIGTRFTNFIKSLFFNNPAAKTSLQNTVVNLANNILKQEYLGTYETVESENTKKENDEILYQLNSTPTIVPVSALNAKEKFLKEVIKQLENRLQTFKRSAKSNVDIAQLKASIDKLIKLKEKGELDLGIYSFVNQAEEELESIESYLVKSRNNNNYNALKLNQSLSFIDMYTNILKDLSTDLYGTAEKSAELSDKLTRLHGKLSALSGLNFNMLKTAAIEVLRKGNLNPYGEPIDPNFKPEDLVEDTFQDISYWRLWAGNYKYAENSPILKNAHKIVYDAISNTQRFTNKTANDLVGLQEKFLKKYKVEDLIAKDKDGNLTHFFERDYHYDRYYKAMDELKQDIAKELEFEDYDDILVETLSPEDKKTRREMWKAFFKKHSQTVQEIDSEGNTYNVTIPAEIYRNKEFDAKMKDPIYKAYYDTIIKTKTQAIAKLPIQYRTDRLIYMLPGIRKTQAERWLGKGSFLTKLKGTLKDAFLIDEDDTQFGEISKLSNKMVPIFFTKQIELKDLTKDIAKSVTMFAEMAENFQQMNKISGDLQSILKVLAERSYIGKDKVERPGSSTKEYQALETLIDSSVFGIEQRNKLTKEIGGKEVSFNKVASRFASLIRNVNLVGNIATIISGYFKGSIDSVIEDQVGIYTTNESKNWSRLEFMKNMAHVIGEIGKAKQTNKMHLILQEAGTVDVNKILTESYRGRAARKLLNRDILYTGYTQADYAIKGRVTLAIYDNHRLYNGKFLTRNKFYEETAKEKNVPNDKKHQKEVQKQWEDLREKSLYNAYEVVNGNLQVKEEFKPYITDAVINSVRGKVDQVSHYVDGTMSPSDKGKLARTVLGQFLLMHRGWFIQLIDSRFKKEGVNFITDEEEIGTYRATGAMLWKMAVLTKTHGIKQALLHWQELSPARKRGVKKTVIDLVVLQLVAILAGLANKLADDDDENDFTTQFTAYQLNRILLEQGAAWNINELGQMIDEPVVGARFINSLTDINEIYSTKVYEKGPYEDWAHWEKWWFSKIPGAKNYHEFSYPEEKNKFIKQVLKSSYYEAMSDKEKHSFVSKLLTYILPSSFLSEEENEEEIYQSLASDEEYNGYN